MELYTVGTGNGQRAAIAVNECGVSCEIHLLNLGILLPPATSQMRT
jgi:hypothetical protein